MDNIGDKDLLKLWNRVSSKLDLGEITSGTKFNQKNELNRALLATHEGNLEKLQAGGFSEKVVDNKTIRKELIGVAKDKYTAKVSSRFSDLSIKEGSFKSGPQKGYKYFQYVGVNRETGRRNFAGRFFYVKKD